jgi:Ca2+-binding EF-hand superfamily protein
MLVLVLEKVVKSQIDKICTVFQTLVDQDNNGYLNRTELVKKLMETSSSIAGVSV